MLTGAVMHEPPLLAVTSDASAVRAALGIPIADAMAQGGPAAAMAAVLRHMGWDVAYPSFDAEVMARCTGNGEVFFGVETPRDAGVPPLTCCLGAGA